ncbi:hypothetical protein SLS62_001751 [Diatrype stigma]|uniref:Uncharacterized protein n=1 Tax=Diatrype stigma TaxID=117547 RepID=A0AAN9UV78_9PEZI
MIPPCNHPSGDVDPGDRTKYWMDFVNELEVVFINNYNIELERAGAYQSSTEVFLSFYRTVINGLGGLFDEQCYNGSDKNTMADGHPFSRALYLLDECWEHVRLNRETLRGEIIALRRILREIGSAPWKNLHPRVNTHVLNMFMLLSEMSPTAQESWDGDDLRDSEDFQKLFDDFQQNGAQNLTNEASCSVLILRSQRTLELAIEALGLPPTLALIPRDLLDDEQNPTYLHYPSTAPEFLYGRNGHRGILHVKHAFGGPITADEQTRMNAAARRRSRGNDGEATQPPKRRRRNATYTLALENVEADLVNMECDAGRESERRRPNQDLLVTPTNPYTPEVLDRYDGDFSAAIGDTNREFFLRDDPPTTPEGRNAMLDRLSNAIGEQRAAAREFDSGNNNLQLKRARVAAFKIKYMRALYMKLLLMKDPPLSDAAMRRALALRLEDWRLHEEIWNTADVKAVGRRSKTKSREANREKRRQLQHDIRRRAKNAVKWEAMEEALTTGAPAEEEAVAEEPEGVVEPQGRPGQPRNAWVIDRIMGKHRPGRSVLYNKRLEQAREKWRRARIDARSRGLPEPPKPVLRDTGAEPYALEGPPGHEQLPVGTVWEKLQYMIVLTHWRIYQGRLIPR